MRQDDIVEAVQEIVAAQLTGYQTKSEATSQLTAYKSEASSTYLKKTQAAAKIKSYLESKLERIWVRQGNKNLKRVMVRDGTCGE